MSEKSIGENKEITREPRIIDRRSYLKTIGATGGGLALGGIGLSETEIESARAATTIIDDFEDGSLSEYNHDTTRSGRAEIVSSSSNPTYDGSYAMAISNEIAELISTSGLAAYPAAGDTFSYRIRGSGGANDLNLSYGVQDHNNRYFVRVDIANNDLMLARYQSGSITWLNKNSGGFTLSQDTWYEVEVAWSGSGDHTATIYDGSGSQVAQVSASGDSTWTSGGIGYDAYVGDGGTVYFDYVTLESSDGGGSSDGSKSPNGTDVSGGGLVVDNFEDGDTLEYQNPNGTTFKFENISGVDLVSSPTYYGDQAIKFFDESLKMRSTSGLENYPSEGSTVRFRIRFGGSLGDYNSVDFRYGVKNSEDYYTVRITDPSGDISIWYWKNGSGGKAVASSIDLSLDTWYTVELTWERDDTHTATIYNPSGNQVGEVSITDVGTGTFVNEDDYERWRNGGIGFKTNLDDGSGPIYYDSIEIISYDDSGAGITVDDFEDGDLNEYDFNSGSTGASVVSSPTFNGSKALEISGTDTEMIKTTGLPNEPEAGDMFSYWVRATGGAGSTGVANVAYGVQDHDNQYYLQLDFENNWLGLAKLKGGSATWLDSAFVTYQEDVWYQVVVDWRKNGRHVITLRSGEEVAELLDEDKTWTSGGVGYEAYLTDGGSVYFDHITKNKYQPTDAGRVVDDFEDGDLNEYTVKQGSPTTTSSPTYFGSNTLEISGSDTELVSTSGLPRYPSAGDHFRYRVRATGGAGTAKLLYGVQNNNTDERYAISIDFINDDVSLYHENSSSRTTLAEDTTSCIFSEDEWFRIEVDWRTDGTHTVSFCNNSEDQLARISGTDSSITEGGIGYAAYPADNGTVYYDHILVDGLGEKFRTLRSSHGSVTDVVTEQLADNGYQSRDKFTYHFEDGSSYEVTHCTTSNGNLYTFDNAGGCWSSPVTEKDSQRERGIKRVKDRTQ